MTKIQMEQSRDIRATYKKLFSVDADIYDLVKDIELLNYVNPINIREERDKFFASKYLTNPKFLYKECPADVFKLQQKLYSIDVSKIEDEASRLFYREIIDSYSDLLQCLGSIGQGRRFYFNCLKSFGTPTEKDVSNANFILHFKDEPIKDEYIPKHYAEDAIKFFKAFGDQYGFDYHIRLSDKIAAAAMVENDSRTLVVNKNYIFNDNELAMLCNHEIGIHLVTTFNGLNQPLKIFHSGFPGNVETQEGLALLSEYTSNCLTLHRLKELAYRVLATDGLRKGHEFIDTFDMLHNQYKVKRDKAFNISLRVHRGGGFTKDYAYLVGLSNVYKHYKKGLDVNPMLLGKVSQKYIDLIEHWQNLGIVTPICYESKSLQENQNTNTTFNFILDNLR